MRYQETLLPLLVCYLENDTQVLNAKDHQDGLEYLFGIHEKTLGL